MNSVVFLILSNFLRSTGIIFRKTSRSVIFKCIEEKLSKKDWPETNGKLMVPRR